MDNILKTPKNPVKSAEIDGFDEVRTALLAQLLTIAAFDGWTSKSLEQAASDVGIDPAVVRAAFPAGIGDVLRYWSEAADAEMTAAMAAPEFAGLKIRQKVAFAVRARLDVLRSHKEAARRAAALMALPVHGLLGARLAWKTSDAIWRGLGDKSTDFNFYSKRGILTGVWTSTFARWLGDDSEDEAATNVFLEARIDNVMQIEKAKAKVRELDLDPARPIAWLAKLRYRAEQS